MLKATRRGAGSVVAMWLAAVVVLLATGERALAQGTSGTLPDPISTSRLRQYTQRLNLNDQQKAALAQYHEVYKQEFGQLRENEIEGFLVEMRKMQGGGMGRMPKRAEVDSFLKKQDRLLGRIRALDEKLFDSLQPLLGESQLQMLPRVKMARERDRYRNDMMSFTRYTNPPSAVDLSGLVNEIGLKEEELAGIDGMLASYETQLTGGTRRLAEATMRMFLDLIDGMEKLGFSEESMGDPEAMGKMMEAMQAIMGEVSQKVMGQASDIADLNRKTMNSLAGTLGETPGERLRKQYVARGYNELVGGWSEVGTRLSQAKRLKDLDAERRDAVDAIAANFKRDDDALLAKLMDELDKERKTASPFGRMMGGDDDDEDSERKKLEQRRRDLHARVTKQLDDTLGPEMVKALQSVPPVDPESREGKEMAAKEEAARLAAAEEGSAANVLYTRMLADGVPAAIDAKEADMYVRMLGIDQEQRPVFDGLLEDYRTSFSAIEQKEVAAWREAQRKLWETSEDGSRLLTQSPAVQQNHEKALAAVRNAVTEADAAFFTDLADIVLTEEQAPRMALVRGVRDRLPALASTMQMGWNMDGGTQVDLVRVLYQLRLPQEELARLNEVVQQYDAAATTGLRKLAEAHIEWATMQRNMWMDIQREAGGDQAKVAAASMRYQDRMREARQKLIEPMKQVRELNKRSLDQMIAALGAESGRKLRDRFNVLVYPNVYKDETSAATEVDRALQLPDLNDERRVRVSAIAAEYRSAYQGYCDQMMAMQEAVLPPGMGMEQADWQEFQKRQDAMARLKFERSELSERIRGKLREVLTPEQIERVGGLKEKEFKADSDWDD